MIEYKEVKRHECTNKGYEKVVCDDGNIWYLLDGEFHRVDGPAFIRVDDYQTWYIRDRLHREDGPARIYADGEKEYWLNGNRIFPSNYHLYTPLQLAKLGLI